MRILVLTSRIPWPLEKGDKLRIYHQLRHLSEKHEIVLCCLTDSKIDEKSKEKLNEICDELHIFKLNKIKIAFRLLFALVSSKPFQVHYFFQKSIQRKIIKLIDEKKPDHIYCQLIRTTEYVKNVFEIPKTLDYMDAFSKGTQRRIKNSGFLEKFFLKEEHRKLTAYKNLIRHPKKDQIEIISNGIDKDFFQPDGREKKYDLVFTGNMNYPPNTESALYIVNHLLPIIWKTRPEVNLIIAGVNDSAKIWSLASEKVIVTGWLDDIRTAYNESRVFVAPMMIGTGLQNKLLEAMSMNLPCITSDLANNALKAKEGQEVLIGKNPEDYALKILNLLSNVDERKSLGESGRKFVHEKYNWEVNSKKLDELISRNTSS